MARAPGPSRGYTFAVNAPLRARTALATTLAALLVGCGSLAATEHNIRELHQEDGSPRAFNASVDSDFGYLIGQITGRVLGTPLQLEGGARDEGADGDAEGGDVATRTRRLVDDPRRRALRELLELEDFDVGGRAWPAQAELGAWLAVESTQPVERFVAVRLVGAVADELGGVLPSRTAAVLSATEAARSPEAVSEGLSELLGSLEFAIVRDDAQVARDALLAWPPSEQRLDATRRLLRLCRLLVPRADGEVRALLEQGARAYARHACAIALEEALADPSPEVAGLAAELVCGLEPERAFAIATTASELGRLKIVEGVVRSVLEHGLPDQQAEGPALEAWLELLLIHAEGDALTLASPCLRALSRFAPTDLDTLRAEEWTAWFTQYRREQVEARAAAPEAGA